MYKTHWNILAQVVNFYISVKSRNVIGHVLQLNSLLFSVITLLQMRHCRIWLCSSSVKSPGAALDLCAHHDDLLSESLHAFHLSWSRSAPQTVSWVFFLSSLALILNLTVILCSSEDAWGFQRSVDELKLKLGVCSIANAVDLKMYL